MHMDIIKNLVKLKYIDTFFPFAPYFEYICDLFKTQDPVELPILHKLQKNL